MNTELKQTEYWVGKAQDEPIIFEKVPSFNENPIDYNRLKNLPKASNIAAWRVDMTNATTTSTDYNVWFRPRRVLIRSAKSWTNIAVMSESYTYDWWSTYTIVWREDTTGISATQTYMDSQNWSAVLLKNSTWTTIVSIATCTITDTWFTLSAPNWTGYTAFSFHYECI
jgi:hypothetical protein